jgi:phosphoribosylglycinamide formyltransferase-1
MKKIVILISGRGSNLRAILQAQQLKAWQADIVQVITNRPQALGITVAKEFGIPVTILDHKSFISRQEFDAVLLEKTQTFNPDLVILAGFMRILSPEFVNFFNGRLINVHPSLLPSFPGLKTHAAAIATGVKWHGATVHFVTHAMDVGPVIAQGVVPVLPEDTEETLSQRVLQIEHVIYPQAIEWFISDQLHLDQGNVRVVPAQQQFFLLPTTP